MTEKQSKSHQFIPNALLASGIFLGLVLCYFIGLPFLPALVWSFTLAVLFAPLDVKIRKSFGALGLSAALTTAIVAVIVVVPTILVIGTLLNETVKSAPLVTSMADSGTWARVTADHPWLTPAARWLNERLNIQQLIQAATSWLAGWSGTFVKGSIAGLVSLLLTFYFLFYLLRDRTSAIAAVENMLPLSASAVLPARRPDRQYNICLGLRDGSRRHTARRAWRRNVLVAGFAGASVLGCRDGPSCRRALSGGVRDLGANGHCPCPLRRFHVGHIAHGVGGCGGGMVDNVLYPILVGRRLMMHTVPSFIAVTGGLVLFGPHGIVLGPVIVAGSQTLLEIWRKRTIAD